MKYADDQEGVYNMKMFARYISLLILVGYGGFTIAQEPGLIVPIGHTAKLITAKFSPDDKFVITGSADKTAKIWETFSGRKVQDLTGNKSAITYAFFSNNNKYVAVGTDSSARIWLFTANKLVGEFGLTKKVIFSPDSKKVLLIDFEGTVRQIDLLTQKMDFLYKDSVVDNAVGMSPDSKFLCTADSSMFTIRDVKSGKMLIRQKAKGKLIACFFATDGAYLVVLTEEGLQRFDVKKNFQGLNFIEERLATVYFSDNNRYIYTASASSWESGSGILWDLEKYKQVFYSGSILSIYDSIPKFSPEGNIISYVTGDLPYQFPSRLFNQPIEISNSGKFLRWLGLLWNVADGKATYEIKDNFIRTGDFSSNDKYMLMQQGDDAPALWDVRESKIIQRYGTHTDNIRIADVSTDGKMFLIGGNDTTVKICEMATGRTVQVLRGHKNMLASAVFNSNGTTVLTNSFDSTAKLWSVSTGEVIRNLPGQYPETNPVYFTGDDEMVLPPLLKDTISIFNLNGEPEKDTAMVRYLTNPDNLPNLKSKNGRYWLRTNPDGTMSLHDNFRENALTISTNFSVTAFSPDEKLLALADLSYDTLLIRDIESGTWLFTGKLWVGSKSTGSTNGITQLLFTDKYLLVTDANAVIHVLSIVTGKQQFILQGKKCRVTKDNKYLIVVNQGECDLYDLDKRKLLYRYISVDPVNYLIIDSLSRFDGTEDARKLLYFTCGSEIISLEQLKDQLWVPNLSARIMKGEKINASTLKGLNICGLTPVIENKEKEKSYRFSITPRKGGLGETVLYVNHIEIRRYKPEQLSKTTDGYELNIERDSIESYFVSGKENDVSIKSYTRENNVTSRGLHITQNNTARQTEYPNLYAVMVGVSDYKGEDIDLKYAAKDAEDLAAAVAVSARKLLNKDSKEHVFIYNINTGEKRTQFPEKQTIRQVFREIGKKATPNDILLIFFAGHGLLEGQKKQFYFLTADASKNSDAITTGISVAELSEWIKPGNIKAQKRILIFDACNSGQAINEFITIGNKNQKYVAARNDDESNRIKAIEKLNERSGIFILSASASNQAAYEMARYSQGLLTYSLLKAIKEQPAILEDGRYLNVDRWFTTAEKTVTDIMIEGDDRQQPQKFGTGNFNIGIVDTEVISKIVLPHEKPMFVASNFQNKDELIGGDDLLLSDLLDQQLKEISAKGAVSNIDFIAQGSQPDTYSLKGNYEMTGDEINVSINIWQNKKNIYRYTVKKNKNKLDELVREIIENATKWVEEKEGTK